MKYIFLKGLKEDDKIPIFDEEILCEKCSYPLTNEGEYKGRCHSCAIFMNNWGKTGGKFYFDRIFSVGEYYKKENLISPYGSDPRDNLSLLILAFKRKEQFAPYCAELLKIKFNEIFPKLEGSREDFIICSVPDLETEDYQKGDSLAMELSKKIGIPFYPLLNKIKTTKKQHSLHKIPEKSENIKDAFKINNDFLQYLVGKKVILVDDITTTMLTANECSKVLSENGAKKIFVFSVGRFILTKDDIKLEESK